MECGARREMMATVSGDDEVLWGPLATWAWLGRGMKEKRKGEESEWE